MGQGEKSKAVRDVNIISDGDDIRRHFNGLIPIDIEYIVGSNHSPQNPSYRYNHDKLTTPYWALVSHISTPTTCQHQVLLLFAERANASRSYYSVLYRQIDYMKLST